MFFRFFFLFFLFPALVQPAAAREITDSLGRTVTIPERVDRVICSGSGCLRLLTYLQAEDRVVAVDDLEGRRRKFDARPYAIANPQFKDMPVFGEFRGHDNPELILTLSPQPQVIFKTYGTMGHDPVKLQEKTGIPVVVLNYGNLSRYREQTYQSLRIMGEVLGTPDRTESVISFFESTIADIRNRTQNIPETSRPSVYLGGVAFKGPHGFQSTEPTYPPFSFAGARNLAYENSETIKELQNSNIAKETIVQWNPDIVFLDLATLQMGDKAGGLHELKTDKAYRTLNAVQEGRVYGVLPYNWYTKNYGSILANAYFIGKLLYPEQFKDIDPAKRADEIYTFLVGEPVFQVMNQQFNNLAFNTVPVD